MNKKLVLTIISVILAVALITTGVILIINNVGDTVVSFESKTALAGDTVKIPFSIAKNHGIWGAEVHISYDPDVLSFASCANGDVFDECEVNDENGTVNLIINQSALKNSKSNGVIAILSFKISDAAQSGDYEISFDDDTAFCDIESELVEVVLENGVITVK